MAKKTRKVIINKCYGGWSYSEAVYTELGIEWDGYGYLGREQLGIAQDDHTWYATRTDPRVIAAVEKLGVGVASGDMASLAIVEIPADVEFTIEEHDGIEWIAEKHRTWG